MRANEFITEDILGEDVVGPPVKLNNDVILLITRHYFDRLQGRKGHVPMTPDQAEPSLKKIGLAKKKMAKLDFGQQFWVVDHSSGIAFGMRRQMDNKKTGAMVNLVGTVVTPFLDGRPGLSYDTDVPTINLP